MTGLSSGKCHIFTAGCAALSALLWTSVSAGQTVGDALGFETPALWSSAASLASNNSSSEGTASLTVVTDSGWTEVTSVPLSSLGTVGDTISFDLNPLQAVTWGEARLIVILPSAGRHWDELGSVPLVSLSPGAFHQVSFPVSPSLKEALTGTYADLQLKVVINASSGSFLLDKMQTGSSSSGDPGQSQDEVQTLSFPLFSNTPFRRVAVGATEGLEIKQRASVNGGGVLVNLGAQKTQLFTALDVPAVYSSGGVELFEGNLGGSLFTEANVSLFNGSEVEGSLLEGVDLGRSTSPELTLVLGAGGSQGDTDVQPGSVVTLLPGRWGSVTVKPDSSLVLTAGAYVVDSWTADTGSTIEIDDSNGPVRLVVLNQMIHRGSIDGSPATPRFWVAVLGNEEVFLESAFKGALVAPHADLTIGNISHPEVFEGAFFAKRVRVRPDTTINFVPSNMFGSPQVSASAPADAVQDNPEGSPGSEDCTPRLELNGLHSGTDGLPAWQELKYRDVACAEQQQFCDAQGNVIPDLTEAELNAPPATTGSCPAIGETSINCGIDGSTLAGNCNSDADCLGEQVCAEVCEDPTCSALAKRCGSYYESCSNLQPEGDDCDPNPIYECPKPGFTGVLSENETRGNLPPPTTALPPTFGVAPEEQIQLKPFAEAADFCKQKPVPLQELEIVTPGEVDEGNPQFGFELAVVKDIKSNLGLGDLFGSAGFSLNADVGGKLLFNAYGVKVDILSAAVGVGVENCGWAFDLPVKLFGERIDVAQLAQAVGGFEFSSTSAVLGEDWFAPKADGSIETPDFESTECNAKFEERDNKASDAHKALFAAKHTQEFFLDKGPTISLCEKTNFRLGTDYDCLDPETLNQNCVPQAGFPNACQGANVANEWNDVYKFKAQELFQSQLELDIEKRNYSIAGGLRLLDLGDDYSLLAAEVRVPVLFFTLQLAVEAFGGWSLAGEMQAGLDYTGNLPFVDIFTGNGENPFTPLDGDLGFYAGPVITPGAHLTAIAFAGVGIPGLSVGLEGHVRVIGVTLPSDARLNLVRVPVVDTRDRQSSDWAGELLPSALEPKAFEWKWQTSFGSRIDIDALSGKLSLAARLRLLFFKKTFRHTLLDWDGYRTSFNLVGDSSGNPLRGDILFGKHAETVAFAALPRLVGDEVINNPDPEAEFPGVLGNEECIVIAEPK